MKWMAMGASALFLLTGCEWSEPGGFQKTSSIYDVRALWSVEETTQIEVKGDATEFGRIIQDGKVDFALVTPSLSRSELLTFDLSALISPQSDRIRILTENVDIPSNISLPKQRERYSLFNFELNKPTFRAFVKNPGTYTFSAVRGQFPVREVIDDMRNGKSIFDVINYFNFTSFGQITTDVQGPLVGQDIAVGQHQFTGTTKVMAPALAQERIMLALSLSDVDGLLSPVDLKSLKGGAQLDLKTSSLGLPFVLALMLEKAEEDSQSQLPNFDKLSFSLLPAEHSQNPVFLDYVAAPVVTETEIQLSPPALLEGLSPVATYLSFSEIRKIQTGSVTTEERTTLWESWNQSWTTQFPKPNLDFEKNPDRVYRWEVLFLAQDTRVPVIAGDEILDSVTHISRNVFEE